MIRYTYKVSVENGFVDIFPLMHVHIYNIASHLGRYTSVSSSQSIRTIYHTPWHQSGSTIGPFPWCFGPRREKTLALSNLVQLSGILFWRGPFPSPALSKIAVTYIHDMDLRKSRKILSNTVLSRSYAAVERWLVVYHFSLIRSSRGHP